MKKEGRAVLIFIVLTLILFSSFFVLAEDDEQSKVDQAYACLDDQITIKGCSSLSLEEQAFSLLASGKCQSELQSNSDNNGCWPDGNCNIKDTGLAVIALNRGCGNTNDAEAWLLSRKKTPTDLIWFLEIDASEQTQCTINYDGSDKTITIAEDKKISGNAGTCLSLAQSNYWLKIKDTCYEKNFTVSCNKGFVSTLLYKKTTGSTIYVSSETQSASAEGTTKHRVNSFCFSETSSCNYEGSLWATIALAKTNNDISGFLPYLIAMADESSNLKYFPSAFLYMLTDYDEYFTTIIDEQKPSGYWQVSTDANNKFYDTALALLALYGLDADQMELGKSWLLEVQGEDGCWRNNIRDTAFILYALWPKSISVSGCGGGGDIDGCEDYNHFCVSPLECAQSDLLSSFSCQGADVCCSAQSAEQTCSEKQGIICTSTQTCTGAQVPASDATSCCQGSCIESAETTECEDASYSCRYDCLDEEEEKPYECSSAKKCCGASTSSSSSWWIWLLIILLIILIVLVALAIVYRNQVKIWFFRIKNKFKKGPGPTSSRPNQGPRFPPQPPAGMQRPRMFLPRGPPGQQPIRQMPPRRPGPIRKVVSKADQELEETLKKLREMSK